MIILKLGLCVEVHIQPSGWCIYSKLVRRHNREAPPTQYNKKKANPFARLRLISVWMPHCKLNYAKSGGTLQYDTLWLLLLLLFTCVAPVALESWPCSWGMCFLASWMSFSSLGEGFRLYSSFKAWKERVIKHESDTFSFLYIVYSHYGEAIHDIDNIKTLHRVATVNC